MSDPRIVEYLRLNMGKYPVDALKAALVKQGFSEADVEAAAAHAAGDSAPPPAPSIDGQTPAEYVLFGPKRMVANASGLFKDPADFFSRLDPEAGYGPAISTIAAWGAVSGVLTLLISFVKPSPFGIVASAVQIVVLPIMAILMSFIAAGIFHVVCLVLGGKGSYKMSYQVIAAMSALFPISTVLGAIPFGTVPIQLYGLFLSVTAAAAAHSVVKARAWIAFGILTAIGVLGSIFAHIGMKQMEQGGLGMRPAIPGQPQAMPPEAAQMLSQLGGQMTPEAQEAMKQAMENPGAILQELTRYGNLETAPESTLALLDAEGQARLSKAWPQMSAPMRKSLIETLPSVPPAERNGFMDQMDAYTKDLNTTLNESMKMIQQAMDQQQAPAQKRR